MSYLDWQSVCFDIPDAEDKLPSLRIRKIKQLLKWLRSIDLGYAMSEGIDLLKIAEAEDMLETELWLRRKQEEGEIGL